MKLREELDKLVNKANEDLEPEMIQCVLKIKDIGNAYSYEGIIEDNSNYGSEYDMENEFADRLDEEDPTIQFILAYHEDGKEEFYTEEGELLDLDMSKNDEFRKALDAKNNSLDNTVIPDKDMIESVNEKITPSKFKKADLKGKSIKELKSIVKKEFQKIPPFINDMSKEEIIDMLCEPDFD